MYKTKYFKIQELVANSVLQSIGENNCWLRLDPQCLKDLDKIRAIWGSPLFINTFEHQNRGLRHFNTTEGAKFSTHKQGTTFDLVPKNGKYWELWNVVHELIKNGELKGFNTMEDRTQTPTWVHVGKMNTIEKPLIIKWKKGK